jgi:hypothetical protein
VAERMPSEARNPYACPRRPQVAPHEVAVAERRPCRAWEKPVRTCGPYAEPVLEDGNER